MKSTPMRGVKQYLKPDAFHLSLTVLCSLSVMYEYLGLEGGPPMFRQDFTCPALLKDNQCSTLTGLSPTMALLSRSFC